MVFDFWPHFLSIDCRKSRNSSFSILSLLFSYLYSANVLAGFLPRCFAAYLLVVSCTVEPILYCSFTFQTQIPCYLFPCFSFRLHLLNDGKKHLYFFIFSGH